MPTEKSENITENAAAPAETLFPEAEEDCAVFITAKDIRAGILSQTPPVPAEELTPTRGASTRRYVSLVQKTLPALPLCALLTGVLWALTVLLGFDHDIGHIQPGCAWFYLLLIPLLAGVALTGLLFLPARRVRQYRLPHTGVGETFTALFAAALFGFYCLREIYTLSTTPPPAASQSVLPNLGLPTAVVMIFCTLYLLLTGLGKRGLALSWCAMGSAAGCMLALFRDYFDFTLPLNSPLRHMNALILMALMLFFVTEARMHTDLWYTTVPYSTAVYAMTILITGGLGLGQAILAATGNIHFSLIREMAYVAMGGLAFCRLKSLTALVADHLPPPPSTEDIRKAARKNGANTETEA